MRNKYRYLVAVLIIAIFCTLFFFQKQNEEEQHIEYRAQNEFVTIEIHSFADAETFEKWKPDDMSITSNLKEVEKSGERLVIGSSGESNSNTLPALLMMVSESLEVIYTSMLCI